MLKRNLVLCTVRAWLEDMEMGVQLSICVELVKMSLSGESGEM